MKIELGDWVEVYLNSDNSCIWNLGRSCNSTNNKIACQIVAFDDEKPNPNKIYIVGVPDKTNLHYLTQGSLHSGSFKNALPNLPKKLWAIWQNNILRKVPKPYCEKCWDNAYT